MHAKYPSVEVLSVHLKDGQTVIFVEEEATVGDPPKQL